MSDENKLPTEVTLKGTNGELTIPLLVPGSRALRHEVAYASTKSQAGAAGAALGLCSSAIRQHVRWDRDVLGFGQRVLDWLLEQGVPYLDAIEAGKLAWVRVTEGLIGESEVAEAEGFSAPGAARSTS